MKKYFIILALGVLYSFASRPNDEVKNVQTANVEKTDGLFVFINSTPAAKYENLGTVKTPTIVKNDKLQTTIDAAIKHTKKQYPTAQGIIISEQYNWQAIKFVN